MFLLTKIKFIFNFSNNKFFVLLMFFFFSFKILLKSESKGSIILLKSKESFNNKIFGCFNVYSIFFEENFIFFKECFKATFLVNAMPLINFV